VTDEAPARRQRRTVDDKDQARAKVVSLLRMGVRPAEAMAQVGRTEKTYTNWRSVSPRFRQQADSAIEAFVLSQAKAKMTWRERQDEFEPVRPEDYATWTEYQVAFRKAYFNHDTFDHQWVILQAWEKAPVGGITLVLIPPEGGKTTLLCDTICGDLAANANLRRAVISEGSEFASRIMSRIQKRFTHDGGPIPPLIEHFGPFIPPNTDRTKKWNSEQFTLALSDHDEQDPSMLAVGIFGAIRGARWDAIDLDDVQSVRKLGDTQRIMRVFRGDVIPRPGKQGRIRITGSRVGREDFYGELERLDMLDEIIVIPALDLTKPLGKQSYFPRQYDAGGLPIVNEAGDQMGWDDADLAVRRKKVGEDEWERVYMQRPQSDFASMISEAEIAEATDAGRLPGHPFVNAAGRIATLDPALAGHAAFTIYDYTADHLAVIDVVDLFQPTTNQRLFGEIERLTQRYKPEWWVIEENALQQGYIVDDVFVEMRNRYGFNAIPHHTGEGNRKADPILGVPSMLAAIVRGEIRFPRIGPNDTAFATLFDQLMAWRPDIPTRRLLQDQVMSMWFGYRLWRKLREQVQLDLSTWRRPGLREVTLYPDAGVNIDGGAFEVTQRAAMTYEQTWEHLVSG
jgi:hypothetical protein